MTEAQPGVAAQKLLSFIERIERLEAEKADLAIDIREVYAEAKGNGFDTKIMRKVVKLRKMAEDARKEEDEVLALYRDAVGIGEQSELPLERDEDLPTYADVRGILAGPYSEPERIARAPDTPKATVSPATVAKVFAAPAIAPLDDMPDIPPALRRVPASARA